MRSVFSPVGWGAVTAASVAVVAAPVGGRWGGLLLDLALVVVVMVGWFVVCIRHVEADEEVGA